MSRERVCWMLALTARTGCARLAKPSVRSALIDAGARPAVADCMAEWMTDRLSIAQLRHLNRLKLPGEKVGDPSANDIVVRIDRIGDPEVVAATASAGALYSIGR